MKIKITSQDNFIIDNLARIIESYQVTYKGEPKKGYSNAIEFGLSELVRDYMRKIARKDEESYRYKGILEQAIALTENKVKSKLRENRIEFDLKQYFNNTKVNLKYPEKEIIDLKDRLLESREIKRIGERQRIYFQDSLPFDVQVEIIELGLCGSIEGLLAIPIAEELEINFENVINACTIEGENFPYELNTDEFTFIIDDMELFLYLQKTFQQI